MHSRSTAPERPAPTIDPVTGAVSFDAAAVREYRIARDVSHVAIARLLGVEVSYVGTIEKGGAAASHNAVLRLLGAVDVLAGHTTSRARPNRQKTAAHGTVSMYGNNACRCEPCTRAWADYYRDRKRRLRAEQAAKSERAAEEAARGKMASDRVAAVQADSASGADRRPAPDAVI